jgi:methylenetetrahydrofolate reductase (NADPH)
MTTSSAPPAAGPSGVAARIADPARRTVSFELYPPRTPAGMTSLQRAVERLAAAGPDFFSVTYGASGSTQETSREVVRWLKANTDADVVAHLTCVGVPWDELRRTAEGFLAEGVRDLLALRGDPPRGVAEWAPHPDGLRSGSELVARLRELGREHGVPLSVGVAATPSAAWARPGETPAPGRDDVLALRAKQDAGADYAITQVFFAADAYAGYVAAARAAGVRIPVLPGVVPLVDPARLRRLEEISGVPVPPEVLARLDACGDDGSRADVGRALGVGLVDDVFAAGAPGVHLYTFNTHPASLDLLAALHLPSPAPAGTTSGRLGA